MQAIRKWHHVTYTYDGTNHSLYVNGQLAETSTVSADTGAATDVQIGYNGDSTAEDWENGEIDEVKIYNYARTPAQVVWDYTHGAPIGHWRFDENSGTTAFDASQNGHGDNIGNHGTLTNSPTRTTSGKFNSAINFVSASSTYVSIPDADIFDITGNFTLSAWINRSSNSTQQVLSKSSNTNGGYSLLTGTSGEVYCRTSNGISYTDSYSVQGLVSSGTGWHHIVAVRNGTSCRIWVDGKDRTSVANTHTTMTANTNILRIGSKGDGGEYFNGDIDEIRIYNYALTNKQIEILYNENSAVRQ